jgi:hypothetical protein
MYFSFLFGQENKCRLINSVLNHFKSNFNHYLLREEPLKYNLIKGTDNYSRTKPFLNKKLSLYFSHEIVDSIFNVLDKKSLDSISNVSWKQCKRDSIKVIDNDKAKEIYQRNNSEAFIEIMDNQPAYTYTIYYISVPVYYRNYAIIECLEIVRSNFSHRKFLLLEENNEGWLVLDVLYESMS